MAFVRYILFVVPLLFSLSTMASEQVSFPVSATKSLDEMALFIKENCPTDEDRLWTLQRWISQNMTYDFDKLKSNGVVPRKVTNEERAQTAFRTKRGICEDFTSLFVVLGQKMGIELYFVPGTTSDGAPHAWAAGIVNGKPCLFDPTWCSGSVDAVAMTYTKELRRDFFMVAPDSFWIDHQPLDPMMQFTDHPRTYDGIPRKGDFNWRDSLSAYIQQDTLSQMQFLYQRASTNGKPNATLALLIKILKINIETIVYNAQLSALRQIGTRIVEMHNMLVDLNYLSHNTEVSVTKSIWEMEGALDKMDEAFRKMNSTKEMVADAREMRMHVAEQKKRLKRCQALMKQKKQMNKY